MKSRMIKGLKRFVAAAGIFAFAVTALPLNWENGGKVEAAYELSENVKYLSDLDYLSGKAKDNKLYKDRNSNNQTIQLVMKSTEDDKGNITGQEIKSFIKGMGAWATSELVYEIPTGFEYFESYIGVDARRQETYYNGGVTFRIYLSNDLDSWGEEKYNSGTVKGMSIAKLVKQDVRGYKYIKLVADENGNSYYSSWYDDAVYADAKFTKNNYKNENILFSSEIKTVEEYNSEIDRFDITGELSNEQRSTILKREYVKRIGYDILKSYYTLSRTYKDTVDWLIGDIKNLEYYLDVNLGSSENYAKSLTTLADLYKTYESDFAGADGDLYKRMAIALSCSHVNGVSFWATGGGSNSSDPLVRYAKFKELHINNRLNTSLFETATIPEMRIIMGNQISDDQIEWLNWFAATNKGSNATPDYNNPNLSHGYYIRYNSHLNWNYNNPDYFVNGVVKPEINSEYHLSDHGVNTTDSKLWAVMKEGAVCGGQSKTGANLRGVYGYPSFVIGQPGHAAYFHETDDVSGGKKWTIGNNIYGWWKSEYGGNMLGWTGNFNGIRWAGATGPDNKYYTGSYLVLEQAAVNDIANLRKSQNYIYMAEATEDLAKKESLYEKAISTLSINVKGWLGLIDVYSKKNVSDEKFLDLSRRIASALKYYPLPMNDMLTMIKNSFIKGALERTSLDSFRMETLNEAASISDNETLQPEVTKTIAQNLINSTQVEMATFSLDGLNAGKIIFDKSYSTGGTATFLYSLTGVETNEQGQSTTKWITSTTGDTIQLTPEQIDSLKEELGIIVKLEGQSDSLAFSIPLTRAGKPEGLAANDNDDVVVGATDTMEWSILGENSEWGPWKRFGDELPNLSGNITVRVRNGATGHTLVGLEYEELTFKESTEPAERKYVSVTNIEVAGSTNHNGSTTAVNVLDGNEKTYWSSTQRFWDGFRRLIFTFKEEKFITALEILPRQDNWQGRPNQIEIAITDEEGTSIKVLKIIDEINEKSAEKIVVNLDNPVKVKNITISGTSNSSDFICISMVSFYEDRTKDLKNDDPGFEPDEEKIVVLEEHMVFDEDAKVKITTGEDGKKYVMAEGFRDSSIAVGDYTTGDSGVLSYNCYALFTKDGGAVNSGLVENGMIMNVYDMLNELKYTYIVVIPEEGADYTHEHLPIEGWLKDKDYHWMACNNGCRDKLEIAVHTAGERVGKKAPTETEKGYTGDVYCSICNRLMEAGQDIDPLTPENPEHQHNYSSTWTGDAAYHWHACDGCDEKKDLGAHQKVTKYRIEATTSQPGYTGDVYCSICEKLLERGHDIDKLGDTGTGGYVPSGGGSGANTGTNSNVQISGDSAQTIAANISNDKLTIGNINENILNGIVDNTANGNNDSISVDLSKVTASINTISLSVESANNISKILKSDLNDKTNLEIVLSNESISMDAKALEAIADQAKGRDIEIFIDTKDNRGDLNEAQIKTVNEINVSEKKSVEHVFAVKVISGGTVISDFKGGKINIKVYTFKAETGKNPNYYHVYRISKDGKLNRIPTWADEKGIYFVIEGNPE